MPTILLALMLAAAPAPGPKKLAVLQFEVQKGLQIDRQTFSEGLQNAARRAAPGLFVMTEANIESLVAAQGKTLEQCEGQCAVDTGRLIGADLVVSGRIARIGHTFAISMQLYDTGSGELLDGQEAKAKSEDHLLDASSAAAARLVANLRAPGQTAPQAAPEAAPSGPRVSRGKVSAAVGKLTVVAKPKDAVRLDLVDPDGKKRASAAPYDNAQAAPGRWKVTARASGYGDETQEIDVPADDVTLLKFDLKKLGGLKIDGTPVGAAVKVTGPSGFNDEAGLPWSAEGLVSGSYQIEVTRTGYANDARSAEVRPGETAQAQIALQRLSTPSSPARKWRGVSRTSASAPTASIGGETFRAADHEWQKQPAPQKMNWSDAKGYCESLALAGGGWRLPDKDELLALYRAKAESPAITGMPGMDMYYWSSSPLAGSPSDAWGVYFGYGGRTYYDGVSSTVAVRCMRSGGARAAAVVHGRRAGLKEEALADLDRLLTIAPAVAQHAAASDDSATFRAAGHEWKTQPAPERMNWSDAKAYCAGLSLAGGGWRLPDKDELLALYRGKESPAIAGMPGMASGWYWSTSPLAGDPSVARFVDFGSGYTDSYDVSGTSFVRCVRSGDATAGNGSETFRAADHEWQKQPAPERMNWSHAKAYCAGLSLAGGGWRLPDKDELLALYRAKKESAEIARLPGMDLVYWSSSPLAGDPSGAWLVDFYNGPTDYRDVRVTLDVRCVR